MFLFVKNQSKAVIEDKKNILLLCLLYEIQRQQLYSCLDEFCTSFKGLNDGKQLNLLQNSDNPIVKAVARFFYLANLTNFSVNSI